MQPIRIAILDLNNNVENQAMRCLREFLTFYNGRILHQPIFFQVFDVRHKGEVPNLDFDIYLSTGGPGSPFEGEGFQWESLYFNWLDSVWNYNQLNDYPKKYVFFICHSYQLMCRFFQFIEVVPRKSTSFGVTTVHKTEAGKFEDIFVGLPNVFHAADFRDWQTIRPDHSKLEELGAKIICLEKKRPHVKLDRAVMGIRISNEMVATQFHPEADAAGMRIHFQRPEKRKLVLKHHGESKYKEIINGLSDPRKIKHTHNIILPRFLRSSIYNLRMEEAQAS